MPAVNPPCMWLFRDGLTFRWARGDDAMTIQRGDHRGGHAIGAVVDRVPVPAPDGWDDVADMRRRATGWLARQPSKTAAGAGASPTPAPAVARPHHVAEVSRARHQ
jgi:hypothetical protein